MTARGGWRPICEGDLLRRVTESRDEIVQALKTPSADFDPWTTLLFEYADRAGGTEAHGPAVAESFERARERLADLRSPALYGGFTGVGWLASHLLATRPQDEDPNDEIDSVLQQLLDAPSWSPDYDLIGGLVGIGVYFLERWRLGQARPVAAASLGRIVRRLGSLAEETDTGLTWRTLPEHMSERQRARAPGGAYNFGVAHGVPGLLALLAQLCEAGLASAEGAPRLLRRGAEWLIAQPPTATGRFPSWRSPGIKDAPGSQVAWCYGDLGVAAALLRAARCVAEPSWERVALATAKRMSARLGSAAPVRDAGLCHGAAGNAHLFNRLYQATGEAEFRWAALHWLGRTLDSRQVGAGVAGYRAHRADDNDPPLEGTWVDATGFLVGAAGIGLALLAATSSVEPEWDRLLLVSIPPKTVEVQPADRSSE